MQDNEGVYDLRSSCRSIRPWTSEEQESGEEEGGREEEKKSRTGKRGKTAYVALPSSSRSCLILASVLLPSSCAVPRRRSPPHDAVMYSMARHSTIMRATTLLVRARGTSELVATWVGALCSIFPGTRISHAP